MDKDRFGALTQSLARTRSRRQALTTIGSGLVAALLGTGLSDAAAQGNAAAAQDCRQGGYAIRMRGDGPRQGEGFQTVGECVSYAAQGGTLVRRRLGGSDPCAAAHSYDPSTQAPSLASLDLGPCDLSNLDLSGANLSTASVINGYLPGTTLDRANLTGANLYRANLNSTSLRGATLINANLADANLAYADLTGADLQGATLDRVLWADTTCPDGTNSDANRGKTCAGHL